MKQANNNRLDMYFWKTNVIKRSWKYSLEESSRAANVECGTHSC